MRVVFCSSLERKRKSPYSMDVVVCSLITARCVALDVCMMMRTVGGGRDEESEEKLYNIIIPSRVVGWGE